MRQNVVQPARRVGCDRALGRGKDLADLRHAFARFFELHCRRAVHRGAGLPPSGLPGLREPRRHVVHAQEVTQPPRRAGGQVRTQGANAGLHGLRHGPNRGAGLGHLQNRQPLLDPACGIVVLGVDHADGHVEGILELARQAPEIGTRRTGRVHVVQKKHARHPEFPDLQDQKHLPLQRQGVRDQHDEVRTVRVRGVEERALGDAAVVGLGVQVVKSGKVMHGPGLPSLVTARRNRRFHGDARQIPHRHGTAGQALEQRGLSGVGVSDEGEVHG